MKSVTFTIAATAFATLIYSAPAVAADVVIVETRVRQGANAIAAPRLTVESGKTATIRTGATELSILPTMKQNGTVVIASSITTAADTPNPVSVVNPKVVVPAGRTATVNVGDWEISFTPSVAK